MTRTASHDPQDLAHQCDGRIPGMNFLPAQCNGGSELDSTDLQKMKAFNMFTQVHEL